ncbi:hypothetical protein MMC13_002392 [Lambiella insularis]|nr:hypothetical protein [Lambiella insularis]
MEKRSLEKDKWFHVDALHPTLPFARLLYEKPVDHYSPAGDRTKGQWRNITTLGSITTSDPSFHVLIIATETSDKLCKTLLSAFLLNYPPPTLINYGEEFSGDNWDKGTHAAKINGVYDFLSKSSKVRDDDLILVVDGYDVWFQLPPEVLVSRYHKIMRDTNRQLWKYGVLLHSDTVGGKENRSQKFVQTVLFGADKLCWPNQPNDPACAAVPSSTLPKDVYGPGTDKDPEGFSNRPRYLNSGTLIGPAKDIRAIYERALQKVNQGLGAIGDQFIFAEILGEQSYVRLSTPSANRGLLIPGPNTVPFKSIKPVELNPGRRFDYHIGLDYESSIFQTMTHSVSDITFLTYSAETYNPSEALISDLITARPPFPQNDTLTYLMTNRILPLSPALDTLPPPHQNSWLTVSLATNIRSIKVPALLHINGDKALLDSWWPMMWFQPHARALLRQYMRTPQPFVWGTADRQEHMWDRRGGRGGAWTTSGTWISWDILSQGLEDKVFADGKGVWREEDGDGKTWNYFGQQVTGKVVDE